MILGYKRDGEGGGGGGGGPAYFFGSKIFYSFFWGVEDLRLLIGKEGQIFLKIFL